MKIFGFIILIFSTSSFLIYENIPLNIYSTKLRKELKEISLLHSLEERQFPRFDIYTIDSIIYSLTSIKSKAVFVNVEMPTFNISIQPSLTLSLLWNANEGQKNYISPYHSIYTANLTRTENGATTAPYEIQFEVEVSKFNFTKTWEMEEENDFYIPKGVIDNQYICFKVKCLKECPFNYNLLLQIVNTFLGAKESGLNDAYNEKGVDGFYKSLPFEDLVQKIYTQTSTSISNENNIDLNLDSMPEYNSNSGLIFYRKGQLNDINNTEVLPIFSSDSSQRFNINIKLIQNLITENLFNIVYEQTNNPSIEYELTVSYLKQIMDISSYPDSTELKVSSEIINIDFDEGNDISGVATLIVNVISKSDLEALLNFSLKLGFKFTPTLLQNGLNFVLLSKNINIIEIKPSQTIRDEILLRSWIQNTYLVALGNNEFNLFSLDFDLSFYFTSNILTYEFKEGYLSIKKE